MRNYWKPFVEWGTGLKANPFTWSRLKLTVLYSTVIIGVVIGYIVVLQREIQRYTFSTAQEIPDVDRRARFIQRSSKAAIRALYSIELEDVVTALAIIGLSYVLAEIALQPIKKTLQQQKQFIENTAHQLKTPLAIMKTGMEVFLKDKKNAMQTPGVLLRKRRASVKSHLEEIERINRVLDDFLTFARIDAQLEEYVFKRVNFTGLVRLHIKKMSYARYQGIRFAVDGEHPLYVMLDAGKFEHALHNVLTNAINYSLKNGVVTVTIKKKGSFAILTITDTGIGIAKNQLPNVFDRFFRGGSSGHRVAGSGLGLFIAKQISEKHKGTISIESTLGKGTSVIITMPLAQTS